MTGFRRKRLESKCWKVGTAHEFLELTDQEEACVELRLKLADAMKRQRRRRNLTQADLTMAMKSSQSRVAKQESGVMPAIVFAKEKGKT